MRTLGPLFASLLALSCTGRPTVDAIDDELEAHAPIVAVVDGEDPWARIGVEPWRGCADRSCVGGRFLVDTIRGDFVHGHFVEVVQSSEHHPNGQPPEDVRLVELERPIEVGRTYAVVAGAFSMEGWTPVLVQDDGPDGLAQVAAILRSPHAFENDAVWQRRRAAWAGFRELVTREQSYGPAAVAVWSESDDGRWLALLIGEMVWIYDHAERRFAVHTGTAFIHGINRIDWQRGGFVLWTDAQPRAILTPGAEELERNVPMRADDTARVAALFAGYRRARARTDGSAPEQTRVWGSDPAFTKLTTGDYVYDASEDQGWFVMPQKSRPGRGYNRVTWEAAPGSFALWHDDELWLRTM